MAFMVSWKFNFMGKFYWEAGEEVFFCGWKKDDEASWEANDKYELSLGDYEKSFGKSQVDKFSETAKPCQLIAVDSDLNCGK